MNDINLFEEDDMSTTPPRPGEQKPPSDKPPQPHKPGDPPGPGHEHEHEHDRPEKK